MMGCFTAKTSYDLPSWIKGPTEAISKAATPLVNKQYQSYNGDLSAGMNNTQTDAMGMLKQLIGNGNNPTIRAIDDVPGMAGGKAGSTQDYMNPYLESVMGPVLRQLGITNKQNLMDVDAKANMAGAFGDTGHAIERAETGQRGEQAVGDATSKAYYDAFNSAMNMKQNDINRISSDKNQTAGLIEQMFGQGNQQQQTDQVGDQTKFNEFLRQQGFDETQLAKITSIIGSLSQGTAKTTPSTASSILGGLASVASIASKL